MLCLLSEGRLLSRRSAAPSIPFLQRRLRTTLVTQILCIMFLGSDSTPLLLYVCMTSIWWRVSDVTIRSCVDVPSCLEMSASRPFLAGARVERLRDASRIRRAPRDRLRHASPLPSRRRSRLAASRDPLCQWTESGQTCSRSSAVPAPPYYSLPHPTSKASLATSPSGTHASLQ